ncbi:MAG: hypothetical protein QM579_14305 [Desulfovibrio sp.]|uniref:hypothetical protein n=1 Tax=Desulfovibrio sp. TaxID=885 RepID=UPI0039E35ABC
MVHAPAADTQASPDRIKTAKIGPGPTGRGRTDLALAAADPESPALAKAGPVNLNQIRADPTGPIDQTDPTGQIGLIDPTEPIDQADPIGQAGLTDQTGLTGLARTAPASPGLTTTSPKKVGLTKTGLASRLIRTKTGNAISVRRIPTGRAPIGRAGRTGRADLIDRAGQIGLTDPLDQTGPTDLIDPTDQIGPTDQTDQADLIGQIDQIGRVDLIDRTGRTDHIPVRLVRQPEAEAARSTALIVTLVRAETGLRCTVTLPAHPARRLSIIMHGAGQRRCFRL